MNRQQENALVSWMLFLGLIVLLAILTGQVVQAEEQTYVYEGEFVVYAQGEFCAYRVGQKGCEYTLPAGVHKFVYADDGKTLIPEDLAFRKSSKRKLIPFEFGAEFDACNSVVDGVHNTCSNNIFFKTREDPGLSKQWYIPSVHAPYAWERVATQDCVVAVVDTGVDCAHPDLKESCLPGYNALTGEQNWFGTDGNGHGTHVAGIAAAVRDNGEGIAGISGCKILPVKVLGDSGGGSLYTVMKGLEYVRTYKGVDNVVVNMSLGSYGYSSSFDTVVQKVLATHRPIIAAAGNDGSNNDLRPHYPSNFRGVLSVGATDQRGARATFSNYGSSVDVTAPGVGIYATYKSGSYTYLSGTSMATPVVSGALALTGKKSATGRLDLQTLTEGAPDPSGPEGPKRNPGDSDRQQRECKEKRLKKCYEKSCHRYLIYGRKRAWRACRKNCQSRWCE